jgi:two-component system response regulator DctR
MPQVLLIDDDPNIHGLSRIMVEKLDCQLLSALSGSEGERMALERKPALILLDIMMPNQDGYETCQRLRRQGYRGAITMVSALQEATGTKKAKEYGANGYLIKPISTSLLKLHLDYVAAGMPYPTVTEWLLAQQ